MREMSSAEQTREPSNSLTKPGVSTQKLIGGLEIVLCLILPLLITKSVPQEVNQIFDLKTVTGLVWKP